MYNVHYYYKNDLQSFFSDVVEKANQFNIWDKEPVLVDPLKIDF